MNTLIEAASQLRGEPVVLVMVVLLAVVWFVIGFAVRHLTLTEWVARERSKAFRAGVEAERANRDEAFWRESVTIVGSNEERTQTERLELER